MYLERENSLNRAVYKLADQPPAAAANVSGSAGYPDIKGTVSFYPVSGGVIVAADMTGLPTEEGPCGGRVLGFHIHGGNACTGTAEEPFADADGHYNPHGCPHPRHAGDMPPLFSCGGRAWLAFYTDRFRVPEIVGRTVIVHAGPDDFTTQPSGNAGPMIACGVIEKR